MGWDRRRVFVTGASGIIGSWLVARLVDSGAYVVALVRDWDPLSDLIRSGTIRRLSVVTGRLEEYGDVERAINAHEIDTVFHLGAQTIVGTALRNPLPTFEANIRGTYNLLEACRVHRGLVERVVVASSDKAYGEVESLPYTEEMSLNGRHPYDVSKSCTDLLAGTYAHTYDLPVTVARCGNVYGGGDLNWSRIVPGTIRSALRGERPIIRSNGRLLRDYIYVQDVVDAYMLLAEQTDRDGVRGEAFNFSLGAGTSVREIVGEVLTVMGRENLEPVILDNAEGEILNQFLDSSKAHQRLGWSPRFTLREGIEATVPWYRDLLEAHS